MDMTLEQFVESAYEKFPGLELESPIQACAYLETFAEGIELFETSLPEPTGADWRWVGVCQFKLFQDSAAARSFNQAIALDHLRARINLAHLLAFQTTEGARAELDLVGRDDLPGKDLVLYYRVRSFISEAEGDLRKAVQHVEKAWRNLQGLPEFSLLAPGVFNQLGVLYGRTGREQRALWFLEHAAQITNEAESSKTRLRRAYVLNALGRLQEARNELAAFEDDNPNLQVEMLRLKGEVAWSSSLHDEAIAHFLDADSLAEEQELEGNVFDRFVSNLALATLSVAQGSNANALHYLTKSQGFIADRTDRLAYRFREIFIQFRCGHYSLAHAEAELHQLAIAFKDFGLLKEEGAVFLHLADLSNRRQDQATVEELFTRLQTLTATLKNTGFLAPEWSLLPELSEYARHRNLDLGLDNSFELRVRSIGEASLSLSGTPIHIPLTRSVELLAYFLEFKTASIADVVSDLFYADDAKTARNYFHQFRHQLKAALPDVSIDYDDETKLYYLSSTISISWDLADVRSGKDSLASPSEFLRSSDSSWVVGVRRELAETLAVPS